MAVRIARCRAVIRSPSAMPVPPLYVVYSIRQPSSRTAPFERIFNALRGDIETKARRCFAELPFN
jgi:hypothetical protein